MAHATPTGKIRPTATQTLLNSDGSESTIKWISEPTAIKRLRRFLAKSGCSLHVTREGTAARHQHGEYFITEADGRLVDDKISLSAWLRAYGLLADGERIDPANEKGWRHYLARSREVEVNGIRAIYNERLTRDYTTPEAAQKAVAHITDRTNLVLVGYDAKGGTQNAKP